MKSKKIVWVTLVVALIAIGVLTPYVLYSRESPLEWLGWTPSSGGTDGPESIDEGTYTLHIEIDKWGLAQENEGSATVTLKFSNGYTVDQLTVSYPNGPLSDQTEVVLDADDYKIEVELNTVKGGVIAHAGLSF